MQHAAQDKNELLPGPFISYSRQDLSFARKLYDALRERKRNAWVDLEGIEPSDEWLNKLYTAIDSTQAFVFIISEASVSSPYCEDEIRRANESCKKLIPILYRTDAGFPEVQVANLVDRSARKLEIPNSDFLLAIDFHPRREFLALGTRDAAVLFWDPDTTRLRDFGARCFLRRPANA